MLKWKTTIWSHSVGCFCLFVVFFFPIKHQKLFVVWTGILHTTKIVQICQTLHLLSEKCPVSDVWNGHVNPQMPFQIPRVLLPWGHALCRKWLRAGCDHMQIQIYCSCVFKMNFNLPQRFRELGHKKILSSNKEIMQPHFSKKVIVLLAVQRNLEKSILTLSQTLSIFSTIILSCKFSS